MWLGPIAHVLILSAMAPPMGTASADVAANLPEPVATRQTLFAIPFRIEPVTESAREPVEVQLLVSGDRGASWQLYSKLDPSQRRFMFRAGIDGEFWFAVRTLDRSGQLRPQTVTRPEMRVIVDTMPAKMQLVAERGQAGQVTASWQIDEAHPKPSTLSLQFRTSPNGEWQEVALDRQPTETGDNTSQTGQVTWWPEAGTDEIQIRAEVSDLAGNLAVSHAQIKPAPLANNATDLASNAATPASRNPSATDRAAENLTAARPAESAGSVGASWPAQRPQGPIDSAGQGGFAWNQNRNPTQTPEASMNPLGNSSGQGYSSGGQGGMDTRPNPGTTAADWSVSPATGNNGFSPADYRNAPNAMGHSAGYRYPQTEAAPPSSLDQRSGIDPPTESVSSNVNPAIQNQYTPPERWSNGPAESSQTAGQSAGESTPVAGATRLVNSREFELEYDVSSVGASGISRVELWGTQDNGQSWRLLSVDDDNRSPIRARVDQEGTYGMTVTVTNGAGLGGGQPRPGDRPQLTVGVDLTEPTVRITSAQPGTGIDSGKLMIRWEANDRQLADRPITLSYAVGPSGPWIEIAKDIDDSGSYAWPTNRLGLRAVYLQLIVRDASGNASVCETTEPISLAGQYAPAAEIQNVRPTGSIGQPTAGRYGYGF